MMYNNKLVVAVKSGGKVLREFKDQVFVPFGSEYTILIKNLNSVRASVKVSIDGTDAGGGSVFVINANEEMELTRFVKNGNLEEGNRFKFIERTAGVEAHRGVGIEDGLIRIEFQFEKYVPKLGWGDFDKYKTNPTWPSPGYNPMYGPIGGAWSGNDKTLYRSVNVSTSVSKGVGDLLNQSFTTTAASTSVNDVGVTVPGSISDQTFETTTLGALEDEKHVIILNMLGETESGAEVVAPVTVKAKPKCITCGKLNKATAKFCSECGTSLVIV